MCTQQDQDRYGNREWVLFGTVCWDELGRFRMGDTSMSGENEGETFPLCCEFFFPFLSWQVCWAVFCVFFRLALITRPRQIELNPHVKSFQSPELILIDQIDISG